MSDKPRPPRCTGKRADGRPCRLPPLEGTTRCWHHSYRVPGRPSRLTPDIQATIIDALLEGAYVETAAQAAGVPVRTLYRWLEKADDLEATALEHWTSDDEPTLNDLYELLNPADWAYVDFRHAMKSAEAAGELELLRLVKGGHGRQPWQAYMTVLERKHPARWGRRLEVKHDGAVDLGRPIVHAPQTDDDRRQALKLLHDAGVLDENTSTQESTDA